MILEWHQFSEKEPPEETILLVNGPLGLDLAVLIEGGLYFKKGEDWHEENLEQWYFNPPLQWADIQTPGPEIPAVDALHQGVR